MSVLKTFLKYLLMALAFTLVSMLFSSCSVKAATYLYDSGSFVTTNYSSIFDLYFSRSGAGWAQISSTNINLYTGPSYGNTTGFIDNGTSYPLSFNSDNSVQWTIFNMGPLNRYVRFFNTSQLDPDYMYFFNFLACSEGAVWVPTTLSVGVGTDIVPVETSYGSFYSDEIRGVSYYDDIANNAGVAVHTLAGYCRNYSLIFRPVRRGRILEIHTDTPASKLGTIHFYGYKIESLGIASQISQSSIDSAIDNQKKQLAEQQKTNDKLDESIKQQEETNKQLGDLNDNLTSEESPNLDSLNNSAGWLPAGPLDSIINLPLALLQNLNNNLSKSCEPLNLTFPFLNIPLELPCVGTLFDKIPNFNSFYLTISGIISALILYYYFTSLYKWVDGVLSFREQHWGGF